MVTTLGEGAVVDGYTIRSLLFRTTSFDAYSAVSRRGLSVCLLCAEARANRPDDETFALGLAVLKALDGEGLPQVLHGGRNETLSWIVTEAIGATEPCWMPGGERVHWLRVLSIANRVGRGLFKPASVGFYHGDLEPACIRRYANGSVCVVGTGALALFGVDHEARRGSPRYIAPESLSDPSDATSVAADIYALGMWMHAALTGQEPFESATGDELLSVAAHGSPAIVAGLSIPLCVWELIAVITCKCSETRIRPWTIALVMINGVRARGTKEEQEEGRDPELGAVSVAVLFEEMESLSPQEKEETLAAMEAVRKKPAGVDDKKQVDDQEPADEERGDEPTSDPQPESDVNGVARPAPLDVPSEPVPVLDSEIGTISEPAILPVMPVALTPQGSVANDVRLPHADRRGRFVRLAGGILLAAMCVIGVWIARPEDGMRMSAPRSLSWVSHQTAEPEPTADPAVPRETRAPRWSRRRVPRQRRG